MAERTGLEPAISGVTGRYSNQLNYRSAGIHGGVGLWRDKTGNGRLVGGVGGEDHNAPRVVGLDGAARMALAWRGVVVGVVGVVLRGGR